MSHFNRRRRFSSSPLSPLPPPIRQRIYSPTPYSPHQCRPLRRRRQSSLHLRSRFSFSSKASKRSRLIMKLSISLLLKTFSLRLQMASSWRRHHLHWAFYSKGTGRMR